MKHVQQGRAGITRVEMFLVVSAASMLMFFFVMVPCGLGNSHKRARRIGCVSNLKYVALSMRLFANDHGENFPWAVSTNQGGSREFTNSSLVFMHFTAASNELVTPKVLLCPVDSRRERATEFDKFSNSNLSYFVSLDSKPGPSNGPSSVLLAGDRNVTGGRANGSLRLCSSNSAIGFTKEMHESAGNIALSDGSAQQVTANGLARQFPNPPQIIRLAIP